MPAHNHTRGSMEITGGFNAWSYKTHNYLSGVFQQDSTTQTDGYVGTNGGTWSRNISFKASRNWTGATSSYGASNPSIYVSPYRTINMWIRTS